MLYTELSKFWLKVTYQVVNFNWSRYCTFLLFVFFFLSFKSGTTIWKMCSLLLEDKSHLRGYGSLPHCGLIALGQVTAKERNILTGGISLEHIKVSVQICGIWKVPSPFPTAWKVPPLRVFPDGVLSSLQFYS